MKTKVIVLLFLTGLCLFVNSTFDLLIHPSLSASAAVGQLADSELAVVQLRAYDRITALLPLVSWASVAAIGLLMFKGDIVTLVKKVISEL